MKNLSPQDDLRLLEDRFSFFKDPHSLNSIKTHEHWVLGLDEVGRGCVAGPVTASAFAYRFNEKSLLWNSPYRVFDSKKLSQKQRFEAFSFLKSEPKFLSQVGECSPEEIDDINILQASLLAMQRATELCLKNIPESSSVWILIDGNKAPAMGELMGPRNWQQATIVKGDSKSFAIASASIVAKETRDSFMKKIAADVHEDFAWSSNVGYPTPAHKMATQTHGLTQWHRKSFKMK